MQTKDMDVGKKRNFGNLQRFRYNSIIAIFAYNSKMIYFHIYTVHVARCFALTL